MLRFFSPNSHFKKSSRQIEFVLSLRKNKIPGDIGRWFAEIAEQKMLRCVYSCASTPSKAMCQDKLKLIDTHGFLWWNRKKDVLLLSGYNWRLVLWQTQKPSDVPKNLEFLGCGGGKRFLKHQEVETTSVFYLEQFLGTQMLSIFTVPCIKCANDGCHDDASRWTTETADLRSEKWICLQDVAVCSSKSREDLFAFVVNVREMHLMTSREVFTNFQ